jgi:hypothetical protein
MKRGTGAADYRGNAPYIKEKTQNSEAPYKKGREYEIRLK